VSALIVSRYGELVPLAPRIGGTIYLTHDWYKSRKLYDGMAPVVGDLKDALKDKPSAIIFDHTGDDHEKLGPLADTLRARRLPVWGGGRVNDALETNRAYGISVMVRNGILVPKTVFFDPSSGDDWKTVELDSKKRIFRVKGHLAEASKFISATGRRWVLKPHDTVESALTYVSKDAEDMVKRLEHADEMNEIKPDQRFMIQEFIEGIEISTEVWVQNGEIVGPPNGTIETKKAYADDLGPNCGCASSVVWVYPDMNVKIVKETIGRPDFKAWLKNPTGPGGQSFPPYNGCLDINCIIGEKDRRAYGIEWTPRFGYSAIYGLLELFQGDIGKTLTDLATGKDPQMGYSVGQFGYSLRVHIPPMPSSEKFVPPNGDTKAQERENWAFAEKLMEDGSHVHIGGPVDSPHVWLLDAQKNGDGYRTAGVDGTVLEASGVGRRIEDARDAVNSLFDSIELPGKFARTTDGADRALKDIDRLRAWDYETPAR
jgi:phosphoribosylamine-glycine ligase